MDCEILQIMPAHNICAIVENAYPSDYKDAYIDVPLIGWALVRFQDGRTEVKGLMISGDLRNVVFAEEFVTDFIGYNNFNHRGKTPEMQNAVLAENE